MNKTTKAILYGVASFAAFILAMSGIRSMIKGVPFVDQFKQWSNWVFAACFGISIAWSTLKKDNENNKDKKDNE